MTGLRRFLFLLCSLAPLAPAGAAPVKLAPVGEHYKIVTVEKSENPQNVLVVYTRLDPNCRIPENKGEPQFDFYWLMDRQRYKPTHRLIKNAIRKNLRYEKLQAPGKVSMFKVATKDGRKFSPEVAASELLVSSIRTKDGCEVVAELDDIRVQSFYGESKKSFKPPFRKMIAVTVKGTRPSTGAAAEKKFLIK